MSPVFPLNSGQIFLVWTAYTLGLLLGSGGVIFDVLRAVVGIAFLVVFVRMLRGEYA